jgi:hypothetical protein
MWKRNPLFSESQEQEVPGDDITMSEILGECKLGWLTTGLISNMQGAPAVSQVPSDAYL